MKTLKRYATWKTALALAAAGTGAARAYGYEPWWLAWLEPALALIGVVV